MRTSPTFKIALACTALALGLTACGSDKGTAKSAASAPATASAIASSAAPSVTPSASPSVATSPSPSGPDLSALSGTQVLQQATTALQAAKSVKFDMKGSDSGQPIVVSMMLDTQGNCTGNASMGSQGSTDIIRIGQNVWMKPDTKFWTTMGGANGAQVAELFKGRWLAGTASDPDLKDMADLCDLTQLTSEMTKDNSSVTKGSSDTVNGQPALVLHVTDGSDGTKTDVWISAQGQPYPLQANSDSGDHMSFSNFGVPVNAQAPPADNVIDMGKFHQAASV
ncbi:hypothetical protein ACFZB9_07545 [Kitasatospora sp. NPDC008050]|uniref:hypothetical protein n=1 Tax=Kitasatospora sp. NPDC008050 TaxID=3364021 RepID=UPI0036E92D55